MARQKYIATREGSNSGRAAPIATILANKDH